MRPENGPDVPESRSRLAKALHSSPFTDHFLYCSSVTLSIHSTTFPSSAS
jgi:hypothetical protein